MNQKSYKRHKPVGQGFQKTRVAEAVSAAVVAMVMSAPVMAEDDAADTSSDGKLIVTATKNAESIQDVPLAITSLTGEFIDEVHLVDVKDLVRFSPGVNGNNNNSFLDSVSVRGVRTDDYGAGSDGSLGFFKNDLFEGRTGAANSTLFDMDRAEIINGPQGFLFGRNAIGGAVSIHTRKAEIDVSESSVDLDVGDFGLVKINGMVNVPINENFAMRFAAVSHNEESYIKNMNRDNPLQDTDVKSIRWSTTYNNNDDLAVHTMVEYEDWEYPAGQYRNIEEGDAWEAFNALWEEGPNPGSERDINTNSHWGLRDEATVLNLQLNIEKEFDFADLTVNAGYKDYDYWYSEQWMPNSTPMGSWAVDSGGDYAQIELRLSSKGDGPLSWYVGTSLYKENLKYATLQGTTEEFMCAYQNSYMNTSTYYPYHNGNMPATSGTTGHCQNLAQNIANYYGYYGASYYSHYYTHNRPDGLVIETSTVNAINDGWAVYANMDYQISDTVNVEFGVRKTKDNKQFANMMTSTGFSSWLWGVYGQAATTAEPIKANKSWDDTTVKALVRWQPTDDVMLYASYTEGYKAGGFATYELEDHDGNSIYSPGEYTNADAALTSFDPEAVESYELGYKDTWFEDTDVMITYYNYDHNGLQVTGRNQEDPGGAVSVVNAGMINAQGIEVSTTTSLTENINLMMNFNIIDSKVHDIPDLCSGTDECEGNKLYWTPENSGAIVLDGHFPLGSGAAVTASLVTYWEAEHGGGFEFIDELIIDASQTWSASIGYESATNWYVEAYIENLTDEVNFDSSYEGGAGLGAYPAVRWASWKPRSFGLRMGMTWD